jgi:hypothetical protein
MLLKHDGPQESGSQGYAQALGITEHHLRTAEKCLGLGREPDRRIGCGFNWVHLAPANKKAGLSRLP